MADRFSRVSPPIANTAAMRLSYRRVVLSSPCLTELLSGVILHDETFNQTTTDGVAFPQALLAAGILVG